MVQHLRQGQDKFEGTVHPIEGFQPFIRRFLAEDVGEGGDVGGVEGVGEEVVALGDAAEFTPEGGFERPEGEVATVGGGVDVVAGPAAGEGHPPALRLLPAKVCCSGGGQEPVDDGIDHRHVNILPFAGLGTLEERDEDVQGGEGGPAEVGDLCAGGDGAAFGCAGQTEQAANGEVVEVVARAVGVGAGLAVAGEGAVDDPGVDGFDRFVANTPFVHTAGFEGFDDDVGGLGEVEEDVAALLVAVVEGEGLFAPVEHVKHRHAAEFRRGFAGVVSQERGFDFDHFRAQVGEEAGGVGAGEEAGEVEDAEGVEGSGGVGGHGDWGSVIGDW